MRLQLPILITITSIFSYTYATTKTCVHAAAACEDNSGGCAGDADCKGFLGMRCTCPKSFPHIRCNKHCGRLFLIYKILLLKPSSCDGPGRGLGIRNQGRNAGLS